MVIIIMKEPVDLMVFGPAFIETFHKEMIEKKTTVQTALSTHVNEKLSGSKKSARKRCTRNRDNNSVIEIVRLRLILC